MEYSTELVVIEDLLKDLNGAILLNKDVYKFVEKDYYEKLLKNDELIAFLLSDESNPVQA